MLLDQATHLQKMQRDSYQRGYEAGLRDEKMGKDKVVEVAEEGEDEYAKTHSVCCDDLIDERKICKGCGNHSTSQREAGV